MIYLHTLNFARGFIPLKPLKPCSFSLCWDSKHQGSRQKRSSNLRNEMEWMSTLWSIGLNLSLHSIFKCSLQMTDSDLRRLICQHSVYQVGKILDNWNLRSQLKDLNTVWCLKVNHKTKPSVKTESTIPAFTLHGKDSDSTLTLHWVRNYIW